MDLWCIALYVTYSTTYTPEVGGSSVWQISKKYFEGVIYGKKSHVLVVQLETFSP